MKQERPASKHNQIVKLRNRIVFMALIAFVILVYALTIVKLKLSHGS
jgi:hypothetical protein